MKRVGIILRWIVVCGIISLAIFFLAINIFIRPSNNRDWTLDQGTLSYAEISDDEVKLFNVRNFTYASTTSYTPNYYNAVFDLNKLRKVYFIVEPFSGYIGAAHTFLSFEFENDRFVSISVEIRKEKGESFSAVKGLLNQYELMYVIADERDVVKLRSNYRKDQVYVYPIKADIAKSRAVFLDMLKRANKLREKPTFYNTLTNTCTTNIMFHVNKISPRRVPLDYRVLLPANADKLAYELGLIDTDLSFEKAREKFLINERAMKYADDPNFSRKIRE